MDTRNQEFVNEGYAYLNNQYDSSLKNKSISTSINLNQSLYKLKALINASEPELDLKWTLVGSPEHNNNKFLVITTIDKSSGKDRGCYFAKVNGANSSFSLEFLTRPDGYTDQGKPYLILDRKYYGYDAMINRLERISSP